MNKALALALSLSLPLPAAAEWSSAVSDGLQGVRFQRAVLQASDAGRLGRGFALSRGAEELFARLNQAGSFQKVNGGTQTRSMLEQLQDELEGLERRVSPTVVSIIVKAPVKPEAQAQTDEGKAEELLKKFFGEQGPGEPPAKQAPPRALPRPRGKPTPPDAQPKSPDATPAPAPAPGPTPRTPGERQNMGSGSGVVIDNSDGFPLIVTNAHVVGPAGVNGSVDVYFHDDKDDSKGHPGVVLGYNSKYDLALVKMMGSHPNITAAPLGLNDAVKASQLVLAVGAPLGLPQTKTLGIVSYVGRKADPRTLVDDFIQTDASINPGNSGGPLFNIYGRVIGINTIIATPNGGSVGLGFAIPVRHVAALVARWRQTGAIAAARIGVAVQQTKEGVVLAGTEKGGPADAAGVQPGDLVLKIDGVDAPRNVASLIAIISNKVPGSTMALTVRRAGQPVDLTVKLAAIDAPPED